MNNRLKMKWMLCAVSIILSSGSFTQARPYPAQEAWPIGFGSGEITKVEWVAAPTTVKMLAEDSPATDPVNLKQQGRRALDQMLVTLLPDRMGYRPSQWGSALACPSFGWHQEYSEVAEQAGRAGTAFCLLRQAFGFKQKTKSGSRPGQSQTPGATRPGSYAGYPVAGPDGVSSQPMGKRPGLSLDWLASGIQ